MIVDTSAIVSIVNREPGWEDISRALEASRQVGMSSASVLELSIVLGSERFEMPPNEIDDVLSTYRIERLDFTREHQDAASIAYNVFGKGRHPARLNFGDCISYATARVARRPLLYVGTDFSQTDVESASY